MATLHHLYVTAHGSYPSGSWAGETAQVGVRLAFAPVIGAPDKGAIFTPTPGGDIVADFGSQAGANGTLTKSWTARVGPTGSDQNADAGMQIDIAEDVRTFCDAVKGWQHSAFRWTHVKIAAVDDTGAIPVPAAVYQFTSPIAGTQTNGLPPQVAMALSARANLVGRRGRGRIYLPALAANALAADGTISSTPGNTLRTAWKALIDNLQNLPGTPDYFPVYTIMSADSDTGVRPVEVRTGSRADTIQSRRRQVAEVYTTLAL